LFVPLVLGLRDQGQDKYSDACPELVEGPPVRGRGSPPCSDFGSTDTEVKQTGRRFAQINADECK